ncbi:MAG: hypothetical protein ACKVHL_07945 [Rhodospirillales bacterium]
MCGQKGKFYQKETVLKPRQKYDNRYSLPKGTRIHFGACFGGYYTAKQKGTSGRYTCKDKKKKSSSNSRDRKDKYKKSNNDKYKKKKDDRHASKKSGKRGDAKRCIRVGRSGNSQTLTNTCRHKVEVVWCHNKKTKATRRGVCGRKGKYYQKHDVIKPGQVKKNQYSLPLGTRINFGACYGGYYTTKHSGLSGRYTCK